MTAKRNIWGSIFIEGRTTTLTIQFDLRHWKWEISKDDSIPTRVDYTVHVGPLSIGTFITIK